MKLARGPVAGGEHLERPPDQPRTLFVDLDGACLAPEVVAHADVDAPPRMIFTMLASQIAPA
ncbi:MAG TPA: hypothetical protein PLL50_10960, partial [Propionicimonas sp.]|nr:hypothetical protein [Propionicimonas sp.]